MSKQMHWAQAVACLGLSGLGLGCASASELLPGLSDNVTCYQHGTPILKTQNRIRDIMLSENMKQLADIDVGQVSETHIKVYASTLGEVTCVVTVQK